MTTLIKQDDLIESVAAALQYISYYHPADFISHLASAYEREQSPAAKDASPGAEAGTDELQALRARVAELTAENTELRRQVAQLQAALPEGSAPF